MKNLVICLSLIVLSASLNACANTFEGAGRDIERAGQKIQNTF